MSPEQALGRRVVIDGRTDIYSLGVTLYELLTLRPAVDGRDRAEILRRIADEEPPPLRKVNPAVPADLETIVLKAMAKDPAGRYATAQELADDLRRFLEDRPIRARRPGLLDRAAKWSRRHRTLAWSAATTALVAALMLAGGIGYVTRRPGRPAGAGRAAGGRGAGGGPDGHRGGRPDAGRPASRGGAGPPGGRWGVAAGAGRGDRAASGARSRPDRPTRRALLGSSRGRAMRRTG